MYKCPKCGDDLVLQYNQWYCNRCQEYPFVPPPPPFVGASNKKEPDTLSLILKIGLILIPIIFIIILLGVNTIPEVMTPFETASLCCILPLLFVIFSILFIMKSFKKGHKLGMGILIAFSIIMIIMGIALSDIFFPLALIGSIILSGFLVRYLYSESKKVIQYPIEKNIFKEKRKELIKIFLTLLLISSMIVPAVNFTEYNLSSQGNLPETKNMSEFSVSMVSPSYNHAGDQIAYTKGEQLENGELVHNVWIMNVTNKSTSKLTNNIYRGDYAPPKFSPDDDMIASGRVENNEDFSLFTSYLILLKPGSYGWNNTNETIIKTFSEPGYRFEIVNLEFSPDGETIYYELEKREPRSMGSTWYSMHSISIYGTNDVTLSISPKYFDISTNGDNIVYATDDYSGAQISVYSIENNTDTMITDDTHTNYKPQYINNDDIYFVSSRISLSYNPDDTYRIPRNNLWILNNTTNEKHLIIAFDSDIYMIYDFTVHPDGEAIILTTNRGTFIAYNIDANGIWRDSDNDGVGDQSDPFPYNSYRGTYVYIPIWLVVLIVTFITFGIICSIIYIYRRKKSE